jgi:hypothetical protein
MTRSAILNSWIQSGRFFIYHKLDMINYVTEPEKAIQNTYCPSHPTQKTDEEKMM